MKALRTAQSALVFLIILTAGICALGVLTGAENGFTYGGAMRFLSLAALLCLPLVMMTGWILILRRRIDCEKKEKSQRAVPYPEGKTSLKRRGWLRALLLCAAAALIALGIFNGGLWDVLVKAINICTECIGLG